MRNSQERNLDVSANDRQGIDTLGFIETVTTRIHATAAYYTKVNY